MAGKLEGKVAVITGGASGIGRATAELYADEGANVVIADLQDGAGAVAAVRERGREAIFVSTDTSDEAACEAMADAAVEAFGGVDVLLAAAGISNWRYMDPEPVQVSNVGVNDSFLIHAPVEAFQKVLDVNLTGVLLSDRAVARRMIEAGNGGAIINIASIMAKVPQVGVGPYCVSKAGVWMLTKVLAMELAFHNIRVNAIGPGFIETPMTAGLSESEVGGSWSMGLTPMKRMGVPEEVAKTALFLACDDSSFYTGALLHPHGGVFTD